MPLTLVDYANATLDAGYIRTAGPTLRRIRALGQSEQMQRALRELDAEVAQIEQDGGTLEQDNAHLQKALLALAAVFAAAGVLIKLNAKDIQQSGQVVAPVAVTAKIFQQIAGKIAGNPITAAVLPKYVNALEKMGIDWNIPRALEFATGYVDIPAWVARMEGWGEGYAALTRETTLNGLRHGWGPRYTANQIRQYAENLPQSAAENLTRTLQLTSYRDASLVMESINGGFIIEKVRIARLDGKTCLSCIALHGTILQKGERVDDHYRGRCTEFYRVHGGPLWPDTMQADSTPGNRRFVPFQSGNEWFNGLSPERQRQQASFARSPAKWEAFKNGTPLSAFVGQHKDDVFGTQIVETSLVKAVGDTMATQFKNGKKGK